MSVNFVNREINEWKELIKTLHIEVLKIYNSDFKIEYKGDKSPVTKADKLVSEIINKKLKEWYPDIPIICEESKQIEYEERSNWEYYFLIDPIDGTKEFISKNGEFTINIGLCHINRPIFGIVTIPVENVMYYAEKGNGAYKINLLTNNLKKINCKFIQDNKIDVVISRSHINTSTQNFIDKINNKNLVKCGSSIKFMKIAEGLADIYPRLDGTMEWDICASQIIVEEAGGSVLNYPDNTVMQYNKKSLLNDYFICSISNTNIY
jgi:3'(2'), 5'-bisphosphate nucleotidase